MTRFQKSNLKNEITSIGLFYKNDQVGGIGMSFNKFTCGDAFQNFKILYKEIPNQVKLEMNDFSSKEELIKEFKGELERGIKFIYHYSGLDINKPIKNGSHFVIDYETTKAIFGVMVALAILMKVGEIKSDNYNGFTVTYS